MTYHQCLTYFTFASRKHKHANERGKGLTYDLTSLSEPELDQTRRCSYMSQESLFKNSTLDVCRCYV